MTNGTNTTREFVLVDNSKPSFKLFIDGDSVAAGVGASSFENSVAGRIAAYMSGKYSLHFANSAQSGKRMKGLIDSNLPREKQDLIVLIISSNDLFRLTPIEEFRRETKEVLQRYSPLANRVVIVGPGRLEDAKALPFFIRYFYSKKSNSYEKVISEEVKNYQNVIHVTFGNAPSTKDYGEILAADKFHPNDSGHKFWFDTIKPALEN